MCAPSATTTSRVFPDLSRSRPPGGQSRPAPRDPVTSTVIFFDTTSTYFEIETDDEEDLDDEDDEDDEEG